MYSYSTFRQGHARRLKILQDISGGVVLEESHVDKSHGRLTAGIVKLGLENVNIWPAAASKALDGILQLIECAGSVKHRVTRVGLRRLFIEAGFQDLVAQLLVLEALAAAQVIKTSLLETVRKRYGETRAREMLAGGKNHESTAGMFEAEDGCMGEGGQLDRLRPLIQPRGRRARKPPKSLGPGVSASCGLTYGYRRASKSNDAVVVRLCASIVFKPTSAAVAQLIHPCEPSEKENDIGSRASAIEDSEVAGDSTIGSVQCHFGVEVVGLPLRRVDDGHCSGVCALDSRSVAGSQTTQKDKQSENKTKAGHFRARFAVVYYLLTMSLSREGK
ncbi:hypothetical protein CHU98_g9934 [Xylaria longipes]|nr:hypothetical protein CHU98_g9934 [Xylaria longipes]